MTAYGVLRQISTPSITTLNLAITLSGSSLQDLFEFLDHSSQNLIKLSINIVGDFEHTGLTAILQKIPSLESLAILHHSGTRQALDEVFERLNVNVNSTSDSPIILKLQKIQLRLGLPALNWGVFLDMCDSRQQWSDTSINGSENNILTAKLQTITLHLTDGARSGLSSNDLDRIAEMRGKNCLIEIRRM
ncbi:hypothetical protein CPB83DRAFT_857765 [Crepidotus variabilis]|uniref:Uncharacterized protein n=1 Tax=Crepidotus variabilis TaxID=179855 RepID=A0A9P6JMX4_9AGAR|nr:hypothetical protein CPB83DRAFT_857765 [Crepidotus variabilis]